MKFFGRSSKKEVTEENAVAEFLKYTDAIENRWVKIVENLKKYAGPEKEIFQKECAMHEFIYATIFFNSMNIRNLFPGDQTKRLKKNIMTLMVGKYGITASKAIMAYQAEFKAAFSSHNLISPTDAVTSTYLVRCGAQQSPLMKMTGLAGSPLFQNAIAEAIMDHGLEYWKNLSDKFTLIP